MAAAKNRKKPARVKRKAKRRATKAAAPKGRAGAKKTAAKSTVRGGKTAAKRVAAAKRGGPGRSPKASTVRHSKQKTTAGRPRAGAPTAGVGMQRRDVVATKTRAPTLGGETSGTLAKAATRTVRRATRTVRRATRQLVRAVAPAGRPAGRPSGRIAARKIPVRARPSGVRGVAIKGAMGPRYDEVLTSGALAFIADLHRKFDKTRKRLLGLRADRQARFDAGELPDFRSETRKVRDDDWKVAPIPADLLDRRVEITGPVDRKMVINALNSGAKVYMADFEDANSPTWANNIEGQINLKDRWDGTLDFTDPASGKEYRIGDTPAVLIVRPRGWHLVEEHLTVDGEQVSGALFDFGLYFFHNARQQIAQGTGPYFYLPKLETHLEARLWNEVFVHAQDKLGLAAGTIKATVLIETLPAAFEMDEILYELRDHIAGLNAGRWDYIFSFIKKFARNPNYVLPDRGRVVMGEAFLGAYAALLVRTCHRRGAFAMGGMAAQIPVKNDPAANEAAFAKVRADKEREVRDGYDGTWVAHPDLVPVAKEVFDRMMPQPNQMERMRLHVRVLPDDLLKIHEGTRTEEGFRLNIRVGVQYVEAWLRGRGAVPIYNLMEDAATAEISRAQIWQWIKYGVELDNGVRATPELFRRAMEEEMQRVKWEIGAEAYDSGRFPEAIKLFTDLSLAPEFEDFLTIPAYKLIA
jgi:malate synthase